MKILITGGAGYVGSELAKKLNENPSHEILIYDDLSRSNYSLFTGVHFPNPENITFIQGNILDSRKLSQVLNGVDTVYHLAAKTGTPLDDSDPHIFEQVNQWGSYELANAIEHSEVENVVYLSSLSVYGPSEVYVEEDSPTIPVTSYGVTKLKGEKYFERLVKRKNCWIIRSANVYGFSPAMRFDAVINRFCFEAQFKKKIFIHGDGSQVRSFIHVKKLVDVLSGLKREEFSPGVYNVVDHAYSINQLAESIKEVFPGVEFALTNQQFSHRSFRALSHPKVKDFLANTGKSRSFKEEVDEMKSLFSF